MTNNVRQTSDFTIESGDSLTIELGPITVTDKDGVKQPVDTTVLDHLRLTIKASTLDPDEDAVEQLTESDGVTVDQPSTSDKNYATAFVQKDSLVYDVRTELVWDAELEQADRRETIARGRIIVVPGVTAVVP